MNNKNQRVLGFTLLASVCALPSHAAPIVWKAGNLSINPYGIFDLNVQTGSFSKTAPDHTMVSDGNLQASRFGVKLDYALGDSGYALQAFGERGLVLRRIWKGGQVSTNRGYGVGVSGPFGSVAMGSLYMPIYWVFLDSDVALYGLSNMAAIMSLEHTAVLGKSGTGGFYDTTVRYRSPEVNGFSTELGYSYGNSSIENGPNQNRTSGFNVRYRNGFTKLGYGFNRHESAPTETSSELYTQTTHVVSGNYQWGGVIWGANYMYTERDTDARWFASAKMVNARIVLDEHNDLTFGVSQRIGAAGARAWAAHAGYIYSFNPNTQLYTYVSHINNNSHSTQGFSLLSEDYPSVAAGYDPWAGTLGIRWSF